MKMKSDRPLLVDGVPQTEFETNEHHGKELIAKGLAVQVDVKPEKSAKVTEPVAPVEVDPAPTAPPPQLAAPAPAKAGKSKP